MAILVTGGTGKTGKRLARLLHDAGHSVYITTRKPAEVPSQYTGVLFEWTDETTRENPFQAAAKANEHIDAVYLVGPPVPNMAELMNPFIDLAVEHGVKRFVHLSASTMEKGAPPLGLVQEHLEKIGTNYPYVAPPNMDQSLENFLAPHLIHAIVNEGRIVTASGKGRIPFISADDIAEVASKALTTDKIEAPELFVLGPESLSYDDVAVIFSEALGRTIEHQSVSAKEYEQHLSSVGVPGHLAHLLAEMDATLVATGHEDDVFKSDRPKFVGKHHLKDFILANLAAWTK
ncbi:hypothetical protein ONZ45_g1528 [Pleurotus djamor]|nr:hypothetical protein ONZ45_g1528 [Pleurotus djamor]